MVRVMEREWGRDGSRRTVNYVFTYIRRLLTTFLNCMLLDPGYNRWILTCRIDPSALLVTAVRPWIQSLDTDLSYRP